MLLAGLSVPLIGVPGVNGAAAARFSRRKAYAPGVLPKRAVTVNVGSKGGAVQGTLKLLLAPSVAASGDAGL